MGHPDVKIEKIGIVNYFPLKHSSKKYYITIPKQYVNLHGLLVGDFLKIVLIEAKRIKKEEDVEDFDKKRKKG